MKLPELLKLLFLYRGEISLLIIASIELFIRVYPTAGNWSIIDNAVKILNFFIPNRRRPSPNDTLVKLYGEKANVVMAQRNRHIIKCLVFFMLMSITVSAQLIGSFKALRLGQGVPPSFGMDTTVLNLTPSSFPIGTLIREINSDTLYYKFPDGFWHPLGGGGIVTADNGLTVNGALNDNVILGGSLINNTIIDSPNGNDISFTLDTGGGTFFISAEDNDLLFSNSGILFTGNSGSGVVLANFNTNVSLNNGMLINSDQALQMQTTDGVHSSTLSVVQNGSIDIIAGGNNLSTFSTLNTQLESDSLIVVQGQDGISLESGDYLNIQSGTNDFRLNSIQPSFPTTEFFRADGTWAVPTGGSASPAGANREMQINDSGVFGVGKIFNPTDGNLDLGSIGIAGNRTLQILSSDANPQLIITPQGLGRVQIISSSNYGNLLVGNTATGNNNIIAAQNVDGVITLNTSFSIPASPYSAYNMAITSTAETLFTTTGATSDISIVSSNDIILDVNTLNGSTGEIFILINRTTCAGAPSNSIANISGVLNICP